MTNRYMKRCPTLLTMREMQIKTTARYCLTPLRMGTIRKSTESLLSSFLVATLQHTSLHSWRQSQPHFWGGVFKKKKVYRKQILERVWGRGTLLHCWWEWKLVQPLWKTVWRFLRKLKICSGNNTPGHVSRQNYNSKRYMNSYVHNSTIHNSQATETT